MQVDETRTMVFGVGYPRTGTTSLVAALNLLGIRSVHNPTGLLTGDAEDLLRRYEGFADAPLPMIYRDLDARLPGSKFILTDRDVETWLSSVEWMIESGRKYGGWDSDPLITSMHRALYGSIEFDRARFRERFLRHGHEVREHFSSRPRDLLVMDLVRGDGWDELCRFLRRPIPRARFPHDNRRVRFAPWKRLQFRVRQIARAMVNPGPGPRRER